MGEFNAVTYSENPPSIGSFEIEIPYEPHSGGSNYTGNAKYVKTWFRIGHSGDRFLHCGQRSAGCITVKDIHQWDEIYKYLLVSRNGLKSIGTVNIIDQ